MLHPFLAIAPRDVAAVISISPYTGAAYLSIGRTRISSGTAENHSVREVLHKRDSLFAIALGLFHAFMIRQ
jgi:hypothetical protein